MKRKIIWILLLIPLVALAADTGWNNPAGTCITQGCMDYSNPTNVYSSNDSYASVSMVGESAYTGGWTTFSPGVPTGASVDGIEVSIEHYISSVPTQWTTNTINIYAGGWRTAKTCSPKVSELKDTYGSSSDSWGLTEITATEVNAIQVKVDFEPFKTSHTHYIDNIQVRIYYTSQLGINGVTSWSKVNTITSANISKINGVDN